MHYLLADQTLYFPSATDQSCSLKEFLLERSHRDYQLPTIVRITNVDVHGRSVKNLLVKNTPLLLLDVHQLDSILAEYHRFNGDRRKRTLKSRSKAKSSKSLVTWTATDLSDDHSEHSRTILRTLDERQPSATPFCRIPMNYHGYFEVLNESDQSIEPYHSLSDLMMMDSSDNPQQMSGEKWPAAFFLRSTCLVYTKRSTSDEQPSSGSADSSYGSLSDLDAHRSVPILDDQTHILHPGQVLVILQCCLACRSEPAAKETVDEPHVSPSPATSWLRSKSRFFFPRKKRPTSLPHEPQTTRDPCKPMEAFLKCRTEQDDIVYIAVNESGLFSPLDLSSTSSDLLDVSGVFQLHQLHAHFRFPLSVRLLNHSSSLDQIYSPATNHPHASSLFSSTKFRLLAPYTEHVIFACPLVLPSALKSQLIVLPIPLHINMTIQRCLNMREILRNRPIHDLIQSCFYLVQQYQTEFSFVHFPLVHKASDSNDRRESKTPLFKKRSQSESHINYSSSHDPSPPRDRRSTTRRSHDQLWHQEPIRRSIHYARLKADKPRQSSQQQQQQQDVESDDENYVEVDSIYDYIRSGVLTDIVQQIQVREHEDRNPLPKRSVVKDYYAKTDVSHSH